MSPKITPHSRCILLFSLFSLYITFLPLHAQEKIFASSISSSSTTDSLELSTDQDLESASRILSSSGTALGQEAFNGHLELQFPHLVPAGSTTYLKIKTEDRCLDALIGGSLGETLAETLEILLFGHQEFLVEAKMDDQLVLQGQSQVIGDFDRDELRVVMDQENQAFIAITPAG